MAASSVSAVILAAGRSARLGGAVPKQLLAFEGEALVRRIARAALAASYGQVVAVVGYEQEKVSAALSDLTVEVVSNPRWADGQSTSVKAGLAAVSAEAAAAHFLACDQPFLTAEILEQLLTAFRDSGAGIVAPAFGGRRGSPVLFVRPYFAELAAIEGDEGGRQVLRRHSETVLEVPLEDEKPLLDVDTEQDLARLLGALCTSGPREV